MFIKISTASALLIFTAIAFCAGGPTQPDPADVSTGYINPHLHPWSTDQVAWSNTASLPQYQYRAANGTIGNYFYVFGEQNNPYANAYNITTNQWQPSTSPPLGNCNWCGVATNNALYIVGRYSGSYGNEIQKFVPAGGGPTGTWTQVAPYPMAMCGVAAAWDGGDFIYAAGGGGSSGAVANAYKYNIDGNNWTAIASMPGVLKYCGGWFAAGKFIVYGGYDWENTCYVYDPISNTWSIGTDVPEAVHFATFSTTGNNLLLFSVGGGGGYGSWPATDAVQIYDPLTDTWTLETSLPEAHGLNSAGTTLPGEVISAGGYPTTFDTYKATGFPLGTPPPPLDIEVDMIPYGTPIQIPANGGEFNFQVILINNEPSTVDFDVWTTATLPMGSETTPLLTASLEKPAGWSANGDRSQNVPGNAPSGDYMYNIYVGIMPAFIWAESHFDFEKLAVSDGGLIVNNWNNWGESFDDPVEVAKTMIPSDYTLSAYPNPFNQRVALDFMLPEAAPVKLTVYDIIGREVTTLLDAYMNAGNHEVYLDGSNMSSGVYFTRIQAGNNINFQKIILMK